MIDLLGYLASVLVLATFCMRGMVALRIAAIASNLAFISYGALADINPVLLLHLLLLPMNVYRLTQETWGICLERRPKKQMKTNQNARASDLGTKESGAAL